MKILKADSSHYQYFKPDILSSGAGYIASNNTSIVGLFSFTFNENKAEVSFSYVFDTNAIKAVMEQFFKDYPNIEVIHYTGKQRLDKIGFKNNELWRG